MREKSLKDISWNVSEETYREDPALSYSTLATYERGGFNCIEHLFDRKDSPALTFGSAVDTLITGGQEEFDNKFLVAEFPSLSDKALKIIRELFTDNHITCRGFEDIPEEKVLEKISTYEYWNNCKSETKLKKLSDEGVAEYYDLLQLALDKTLLSSEMYTAVLNSVRALKESPATEYFFRPDNPFDDSIERLYQLKFKATLHGIDYRCMADLLLVDHKNKIIYPKDLKTSSHYEWEFYKSFIDWDYQIQARLYWRIIRNNLDRDPYFKDFILSDYEFIVVNKNSLTPLTWEFKSTQRNGLIIVGKPTSPIELRDPEVIGQELKVYLDTSRTVPVGIKETEPNDIIEWLCK